MRAGRGVQRIETHENEPVLGAELPSLEDDSLSLEQLGKVYADMLASSSSNPSITASQDYPSEDSASSPSLKSHAGSLSEASRSTADMASDLAPGPLNSEPSNDEFAITPERIVEALLFVGQPDSKPMTNHQLASTMRGVHADEVPSFVDRLNLLYQSTGRVMRIEQRDAGYVLCVAPEFQRSTNSIQGKLRETRLPPAAVDCLALVAYNPGATREEIEKLWNRSASSMLNLLVRKELLEIVREEKPTPKNASKSASKNQKATPARYHPTERFLNLLGLSSLQDLPRVDSDL
ncbi:MAG: SMC-Scp complex subunit ScpB [Planctomycetota bacterium]|nr:SMC-Scp complex subunit ScpB [Planctomycetota bacterium]